jgi:alpha-mannosidase
LLAPFIACEDSNVVVEAIKKAEDSGDIVLRVYECHNCRGRAELTFGKPISGAVLCDLEENEIGDLDVEGNMFTFEYKPFEILTIKLKA